MKRQNKKAEILIPEVVRIIIAVLCIIILIYLAYKLYGIFTVKTETEQAKAHLQNIVGKIDALNNGESAEYLMLNPKEFVLVEWPIFSAKENKIIYTDMPKKCSDKNWQSCMCMCRFKSDFKEILEKTLKEKMNSETLKRALINSIPSLLSISPGSTASTFISSVSGDIGIEYVYNSFESVFNIRQTILDGCNVDAVCVDTSGKNIEINSFSMRAPSLLGIIGEIAWSAAPFSGKNTRDITLSILKSLYVISVDDLMTYKKPISIKLENNIYYVNPPA